MEKKVPNIENGTMVRDMKELKDLGKQMEHLRDGLELAEDERIADQFNWMMLNRRKSSINQPLYFS